MQLIELFRYDFMRYALISGLLLGPTCALLGVFVNLRGMAFFSDALAHSALTGVALGFILALVFLLFFELRFDPILRATRYLRFLSLAWVANFILIPTIGWASPPCFYQVSRSSTPAC